MDALKTVDPLRADVTDEGGRGGDGTTASGAGGDPTGTATPTDDPEERLFSGPTGRLLLAASVGWAAIQCGRLVLSPMLPSVMADLGIGEFEAGVAFTVMWGLYALLQYPSGRLSDRLSRPSLLVPGLALVSVGFLLLSRAQSYPPYLLGAAVVGVGAGLYPTAARALVSDLFVRRRGQAFGLHTASGDLGGAAAAGLAVVVLGAATWRSAYAPVVAVLAVVLLALHRWRREPYEWRRVPLGVRETLVRLFGQRRMATLVGAYVLYAFTWQGAVGFLPTFLQRTKGFSPGFAGGGFAALFVVGAAVKPVSGWLGDRLAKPLVAAGGLVLGATALAGTLLVEGSVAVSVGVVGFAAGLMAFPPAMQAFLMDVFPDGSMGGDLGAARSVYIGLGSLGPTYVGFVAGWAGYGPAFAGLAVCLVVSAAAVLGLGLTR
ncbi:MFS transporter [Halobacteriales archaeon QS_8_69_26]|nr:MAG: MFS transporter [Halobacteriales archaeon QS_8_69_26]